MINLKTLTAATLAAAGLAAPAVAVAVDRNELRGAPQLRLVNDQRAQLRFTTDERLSRAGAGRYDVRITVADGSRVSHIKAVGRHGGDFRYTARVTAAADLVAGRKYTVRFTFPGQDPVTRQAKAQPARG